MNKPEGMGSEFHNDSELDKDGLTPEERQLANNFQGAHEKKMVPESISKAVEKEISKFERLIEDFESTYPLDKLNEIVELTIPEAQAHPFREPARKALIPIVELRDNFKAMAEASRISWEQFQVLEAKYMKISRAVGYHHGVNTIRHK